MEKFIFAGDTATRYREEGNGEKCILLLHGYMESIDVWDELFDVLKKEYRVIAFDLPGHGISEIKSETHTMNFLAECGFHILKDLNIEKCNVIGHSMGGYVALAFAKNYPEMCESITLLHSSPFSDTEERKASRQKEIDLIKAGKKEMFARVNPGKCFAAKNRKKQLEAIEFMCEQALITEDEGAIALLNGIMQREEMNDMLHNLAAKQLFVFGKHDEFIPVEYAEQITEKHPQAQVLWLEDSGHMGFIEETELFTSELKSFLQ
ncbi:MAG: alpha/beta hydrolase [Rikenellaceae bacterium]